MNKIIVTTLPITLRENPAFEMFITPLVAHTTARMLGGESIFTINLSGMRYKDSIPDAVGIERYKQSLSYFWNNGVSSKVYSDSSPEYSKYISKIILEQIDAGVITKENISLLMCSCGRSQFPKDALTSIAIAPDIVRKKGEQYECVFCDSILTEQVHSALVLQPSEAVEIPKILPERYVKKSTNQFDILTGRVLVLSRVQRDLDPQQVVDGFAIDPDVWWASLPFMNMDAEDEVVVVTSSRTLWHASRSVYIARRLGVTCKVSVLVHPYINVVDGEARLSKTQLSDYISRTDSPEAARAFLLFGLQWGGDESRITSDELYLVNHSYQVAFVSELMGMPVPLARIPRILQRSHFASLFKKLRSFGKVPLTEDEQVLARAVLLQW